MNKPSLSQRFDDLESKLAALQKFADDMRIRHNANHANLADQTIALNRSLKAYCDTRIDDMEEYMVANDGRMDGIEGKLKEHQVWAVDKITSLAHDLQVLSTAKAAAPPEHVLMTPTMPDQAIEVLMMELQRNPEYAAIWRKRMASAYAKVLDDAIKSQFDYDSEEIGLMAAQAFLADAFGVASQAETEED